MSKESLRNDMQARRRQLDEESLLEMSRKAQDHVICTREFHRARVVCCYLPMKGEVRTDQILDACWRNSKVVCVPCWDAGAGRYVPRRLEYNTRIGKGLHGAPEPVSSGDLGNEAIDVFVIPGTAFDMRGYRLGRGGGHYDRILADGQFAGAFRFGLSFAFQLLEEIPVEPHDLRMDAVATEQRLLKRNERKPPAGDIERKERVH